MVLDCISPISEHGDKAILGDEPPEDTDIRRLQFPDRILFRPNNPKLPCKDEMLAAQERMEEIVDLLGGRSMTEQPRGLTALKGPPQPFNELWRTIEQPQRLSGRRKIDIDSYDHSAIHKIGDGRHERLISVEAETTSAEAICYAILLRLPLLHDCHGPSLDISVETQNERGLLSKKSGHAALK
jgi:hypothetical protein